MNTFRKIMVSIIFAPLCFFLYVCFYLGMILPGVWLIQLDVLGGALICFYILSFFQGKKLLDSIKVTLVP